MSRVIGILPGSFKPYHAGHDALVRIASDQNDVVHLLVSTSDRGLAPGGVMVRIWYEYILSTLPSNVILQLGEGSPVRKTFDILSAADSSGSDDMFRIYSDSRDIAKYTQEKLRKSAPRIARSGRVELCGISRSDTIMVSGTQMRLYLEADDHVTFVKNLPTSLRPQGREIFDLLKGRKVLRSNCTI